MSEAIKHECGIALIRLLKPLSYYKKKYGSYDYGIKKLYLLMEKQHNRGQEGAGVACIKLEASPGEEYIYRDRHLGNTAIKACFENIYKSIETEKAIFAKKNGIPEDSSYMEKMPYIGEVYMGHLRYSTTGHSGISYVHPFLRRNNWRSRNLCLAGNFNLTNVNEIFNSIVAQGQHPRSNSDTFIMLEQLGYLLDDHHSNLYRKFKGEGYKGKDLDRMIEDNIDMEGIITEASRNWDGGFCIIGSTGSGEAFAFKDRWGIRPCFYYNDDEIVVVASERAVIQTVMDVKYESVKELGAGEALIIRRNGDASISCISKPDNPRPCSFERIYFSRGSDADIYKERKMLGSLVCPQILKEIDYDLDHTVFSFIPNTAEVAYYGMMEKLNEVLNEKKVEMLCQAREKYNSAHSVIDKSSESSTFYKKEVSSILSHKVRTEKLAIKDIKLRTFIAEGNSRDNLATHVYDITYNSIVPGKDNIVVIDDSIVRGTTLKQSIIKILGRLEPKKIIIVSSSPQIRYPDCYGIDMSRMGEFIAFNAAMELLKENGREDIPGKVYEKCREAEDIYEKTGKIIETNFVKEIYAQFDTDSISRKIAEMVTPRGTKCKVSIIYQSIHGLHTACREHSGDWYFSGDYPTKGGIRTVNRAYINFYEGNPDKR
ncbi:MAG: amidophosphoribosyltransferase [Bacteroidales bacterium]|jgi:amidophosphoribosyltransferase|nr:amidophosphoribosyltransferase [Bacteroidales bacterium]